jgi:urea transport system substrate-binding protein
LKESSGTTAMPRRRIATALAFLALVALSACRGKPPIRVGILHSQSGTMAFSEAAVVRSTLMAIEEINASGGLLGRRIEPIVVDGRSDWPTFARGASRLIVDDHVSVIFGCWTSASRKMVKPVVRSDG